MSDQPMVIDDVRDVAKLQAMLPFRPLTDAGRRGAEIFPLFAPGAGDPDGAAAAIVRYLPGATAPRHLHPGHEMILVLEGTLETEHGVFPQGSLQVLPPGSDHAPTSAEGCTMIIVWERPVKVL
jgi:anti-sigma factor ChrR (cupin superfamily)